jgi:hypothetical protein
VDGSRSSASDGSECRHARLGPDAGDPHVRFDERDVEMDRLTPPRHVSTLPFYGPAPFSSTEFSRQSHGNAVSCSLVTPGQSVLAPPRILRAPRSGAARVRSETMKQASPSGERDTLEVVQSVHQPKGRERDGSEETRRQPPRDRKSGSDRKRPRSRKNAAAALSPWARFSRRCWPPWA